MGGRSEKGKWDQVEEMRFLLYEGPIQMAMINRDIDQLEADLKRFYSGYLKGLDRRKTWWKGVNKAELRKTAEQLFKHPPRVVIRMDGNKTMWYVKLHGQKIRRIYHN